MRKSKPTASAVQILIEQQCGGALEVPEAVLKTAGANLKELERAAATPASGVECYHKNGVKFWRSTQTDMFPLVGRG